LSPGGSIAGSGSGSKGWALRSIGWARPGCGLGDQRDLWIGHGQDVEEEGVPFDAGEDAVRIEAELLCECLGGEFGDLEGDCAAGKRLSGERTAAEEGLAGCDVDDGVGDGRAEDPGE
jgi:hypothetical protein